MQMIARLGVMKAFPTDDILGEERVAVANDLCCFFLMKFIVWRCGL